ncbi:hypothetical protein AB0J83_23535 [Actinoplanes sp. NPDC049596]|uniref:hypothetical protein n=1 Tax=unclassified Actinoplanes TaxID=2626549 RepID=UPI00342E853A
MRAELRNLARSPQCAITTGTAPADEGLDVVVEGVATQVAATGHLARLWKTRHGWDFRAVDGLFVGDEGNEALVFALRPATVLAFGKGEPYSQTRFVL